MIVKAGAKITAADAKQRAEVKEQITWPVKAKVTNEIVYLDASAEESSIIASAGEEVDKEGYFVNERVSARRYLQSGEVDANEATHMDAARNQIIGSSASLIPFVEKDYVYRALMGSNQQRQAVPLVTPQSPVVGTGTEHDAAINTGQLVMAEGSGTVIEASADKVVVEYKGVTKTYEPQHFVRSNE